MNTIGKLFTRIATSTTLVLLALVTALPLNASVLAAAAFVPDDFNRCSLDTGIWQFQNPGSISGISSKISGQYTGDSTFDITLPAGAVATFSNTNKFAPRIIQPASDTDFELEVKFNSPLGQMSGDNWNMQGILVRDSGNNRWLRFDLDSNSTHINYFVGYIDETGKLYELKGPATISTTLINEAPLYLRVKFEKALNRWSVGYGISNKLAFAYRYNFVESDPRTDIGLPSGFNFNVTDVAVFAGTTGSSTPGFVSKVDYIKSVPDAFTDDAFTINVTKNGSGTVNWPMTNPAQQCSGNVVTIKATPASGNTFTGWSGDVTSAAQTIQLTMSRAYNLIATFSNGQPVVLDHFYFLPIITK